MLHITVQVMNKLNNSESAIFIFFTIILAPEVSTIPMLKQFGEYIYNFSFSSLDCLKYCILFFTFAKLVQNWAY